MTRTEAQNKIYDIVKEAYGDCLKVLLVIDTDGIECTADARPFTVDCSMRTINGQWLEKRDSFKGA